MGDKANPLHSKLRISSQFIILGLVIQAISLFWNHPLSFIAFATAGGLLLAIGIVLYLITLANIPVTKPEEPEASRGHVSES